MSIARGSRETMQETMQARVVRFGMMKLAGTRPPDPKKTPASQQGEGDEQKKVKCTEGDGWHFVSSSGSAGFPIGDAAFASSETQLK